MDEKRTSRILTCELSPDNSLNFTYENPFGADVTGISKISGTQKNDGSVAGQQEGLDNEGRPYTVRTGEPNLASDSLQHDALPRVVQKCRDALKP